MYEQVVNWCSLYMCLCVTWLLQFICVCRKCRLSCELHVVWCAGDWSETVVTEYTASNCWVGRGSEMACPTCNHRVYAIAGWTAGRVLLLFCIGLQRLAAVGGNMSLLLTAVHKSFVSSFFRLSNSSSSQGQRMSISNGYGSKSIAFFPFADKPGVMHINLWSLNTMHCMYWSLLGGLHEHAL